MASPWDPPKRPPVERPWVGMALLVAVPVLALILIRMLWSGSSLWFLTVGIILLGAAAVLYLVRRPQETPYDRRTLEEESNRGPLILVGLGVLFLAMLVLPNFSGGGSGDDQTNVVTSEPPASDVADTVQPPAQLPPLDDAPPAVLDEPAAGGEETYIVVSGDTLWDIAQRFGTTVDAILDANPLENPSELQVGDELLIVAAPADAPSSPPAAVDEPVDAEPPSLPGGTYVVAEGDNLWSIAGQFDVTIEAIVDANALEDPKSLQVGQELLIPEPEPGDAESAGE